MTFSTTKRTRPIAGGSVRRGCTRLGPTAAPVMVDAYIIIGFQQADADVVYACADGMLVGCLQRRAWNHIHQPAGERLLGFYIL